MRHCNKFLPAVKAVSVFDRCFQKFSVMRKQGDKRQHDFLHASPIFKLPSERISRPVTSNYLHRKVDRCCEGSRKKNPAFPVIHGLSKAINRPNRFVCINHNIPTSGFWPRTGLIGCHSQELMWFVMLLIFPSGLF